jgi:type II secretory pathway pseudopilin PulG
MVELLILLVLVGLVGGTLLLVKQRRDASGISSEQRAELRDAKRQVRQVKADHSTAIKAAQRGLKKAEQSYEQQIDAAQKRLVALQEPRGRKLATFQKHTLYEHAIVTTNGEANLDGVHAEVDTAGNLTTKSRATLTRMAAGGLLLGPLGSILSLGLQKTKEIDKRELYLLIVAANASSVVQCPPDEGLKAREFAMKVNAAAAAEAGYRQRLPALLDQARQQLRALSVRLG